MQRGGAQGDQRLVPRLPELLSRGPGNPLRQHRQGPARLLELGERAPFPLEDRECRRVERIARLEPAPEKISALGRSGSGVHGSPLGGKPSRSLKAPVGVGLGHQLAHALFAEVLEQASSHDLADLGLVVGNEVACDASHDLGDTVLPPLVPLRHLDLAARQADDGRGPGRTGCSNGQVLEKGVKGLGHAAVAVDEVQHLVEQQQHRRLGGGKYPSQSLGTWWRGLRSIA